MFSRGIERDRGMKWVNINSFYLSLNVTSCRTSRL